MADAPLNPARWRAVALVGLRGSGKTTLGRALAARLHWPFADCDEELARAVGQSAGAWLSAVGEARFREQEAVTTGALLSQPGRLVVATGGGAVTVPALRRALAAPDLFVVWLQAPVARLAARVRSDRTLRPPLAVPDVERDLEALAAARESAYAAVARCAVDTAALSIEQCIDFVLAALLAP